MSFYSLIQKKASKNKFITQLITVLLIAVVSGCGESQTASGTSSSQKLEKVRVAADAYAFTLPFRVTHAKEFYKKYGIDAEITTYSFGIDTLNALVTKQVDTAEAMDYATLTRLGKGDHKIVSVIASPTQDNQILFVKDNVTKPEDLKGKRLGVQRGTVNEYIWARYLEKYKINKTDVTFAPLTSIPELLTAFDRGDIDAIWVTQTFVEKAKKVKGAKQFGDLSAINFRMIGFLTVDGRLLKEKPRVVANLLKALDEGNQYVKQHPDEAAELAYKELKLPKEEVLTELKNNWDFDVRFRKEDYEQLNSIKDWAVKNGVIKENFNLKDYIDLTPLKSAFSNKVTYTP